MAAHPGPALMWVAAFVLLVWSTHYNHEELGKWALWLSLVALFSSVVRVARWVVRRMTHITALWHDDVVQTDHRHDRPGQVAHLPLPTQRDADRAGRKRRWSP